MTENENTPMGSNNAGTVIGWFAKIGEWVEKHGLKSTFTGILVTFIAIIVGYFAFNPEAMFDKFREIEVKAHNEAIQKRIAAEPQIRASLIELRNVLFADRAYILETHNGGSNLSNLPFLYVDLTYAEPKKDFSWLESEYKNIRLSRYPWATHVYDNSFWFGPIEDLLTEDPELYYRLQSENVKYMGMLMMYGIYNPSGVLGVVYSEDVQPSVLEIKQTLLKYSALLSPLLNNEKEYN